MSNQGWANQQPNQQQGWASQQPNQQQGWASQQPNQQQGWNNQPQQQQGFQPQQQQGWNNQPQQAQQGWNNQPQQPQQQQGWDNQPQQGGKHGHGHGHGHGNKHKQQSQSTTNQVFTPAQHQLYKLCSGINHKFVLDVSQNPQELNKLILFKDHNTANQKFLIQSMGNNRYALFCSKNNLTVEVPSPDKGARVHCSQPNKQANEIWEFVPANGVKGFEGKNAFYLKSCTGKCLDVSGGKAKEQTHIVQWDFTGNQNQIWVIEPTN